MYRRLPLIAGLFLAAASIGPVASSAAPTLATMPATEAGSSLPQLIQYSGWRDRDYRDRGWRDGGHWGHCRAWRHRCAARWGWGGWEFRRCLRRHGCGGPRY